MENRYYIPELEEFHVGFEFEFKDWWTDVGVVDKEGKKGSEYQKHILTPWDFYSTEYKEKQIGAFFGTDYEHIFDRIQKYINNEDIRVKYLDQEDIESLGWEKIREDTFEMKLPEYRGMLDVLVHLLLSSTLLICVGESESPFSDWRTLFTGTVKNKSELKKIMKMLGI